MLFLLRVCYSIFEAKSSTHITHKQAQPTAIACYSSALGTRLSTAQLTLSHSHYYFSFHFIPFHGSLSCLEPAIAIAWHNIELNPNETFSPLSTPPPSLCHLSAVFEMFVRFLYHFLFSFVGFILFFSFAFFLPLFLVFLLDFVVLVIISENVFPCQIGEKLIFQWWETKPNHIFIDDGLHMDFSTFTHTPYKISCCCLTTDWDVMSTWRSPRPLIKPSIRATEKYLKRKLSSHASNCSVCMCKSFPKISFFPFIQYEPPIFPHLPTHLMCR